MEKCKDGIGVYMVIETVPHRGFNDVLKIVI